MASLNRVCLLGNVGCDPEIAVNGRWAKFPLATKEYNKDTREKFTDWHDIILMGYLVNTAKRFISKGSTLYLEGRLKSKTNEQGKIETYVLWDKLELVAKGESNE